MTSLAFSIQHMSFSAPSRPVAASSVVASAPSSADVMAHPPLEDFTDSLWVVLRLLSGIGGGLLARLLQMTTGSNESLDVACLTNERCLRSRATSSLSLSLSQASHHFNMITTPSRRSCAGQSDQGTHLEQSKSEKHPERERVHEAAPSRGRRSATNQGTRTTTWRIFLGLGTPVGKTHPSRELANQGRGMSILRALQGPAATTDSSPATSYTNISSPDHVPAVPFPLPR